MVVCVNVEMLKQLRGYPIVPTLGEMTAPYEVSRYRDARRHAYQPCAWRCSRHTA